MVRTAQTSSLSSSRVRVTVAFGLDKSRLQSDPQVSQEPVETLDLQLPEDLKPQWGDYLKLQELYEQREALEEEILKLYGTWESLSAQLEEARG